MNFQQAQHDFVRHIRDPQHQPAPGDIDDRRMAVYRELLFNNVNGFVSSAFPVLKSLYDDSAWQTVIRQFFKSYHCDSPYFLNIAEHFLQFLQQDYQLSATDPVFMLELAHYEWAELYLATKQQQQLSESLAPDQVISARLMLSDLALLVAYQYPVHQISTAFQPTQPDTSQFYLLYRNEQDEVKFIYINQITAALLQCLLQAAGSTLVQLIEALAPSLPQFSKQQLTEGALIIMQDFAAKGIVQAFQTA